MLYMHRQKNRRKGHIIATYADNCFLPFALLAANTFLPFAVAILALKPYMPTSSKSFVFPTYPQSTKNIFFPYIYIRLLITFWILWINCAQISRNVHVLQCFINILGLWVMSKSLSTLPQTA